MCVAHAVGPGLGAEHADAQGQALEVHAQLFGALDQVHEVARGAAQRGDAEVAQHHDLAVGVAPGDGHHGGAQGLGAVVGAEPAGEESVAEGVLEYVAAVQSAGGEGARHDLAPHRDVFAGVGDDDRLAGGAGGGVQAHDVAHGTGEESVGVGVAQIGLDGEGQPGDVGEPSDGLRGQVARLQALAEQRHVGVGARDHRAQAAQLDFFQPRGGQVVGRAGGVKAPGGIVPQLGLHGACPRRTVGVSVRRSRRRRRPEGERLLVERVQLGGEVGVQGREPVLLGDLQVGRERAQEGDVEALFGLERAGGEAVGAEDAALGLEHRAVDVDLGGVDARPGSRPRRPGPWGSRRARRSARRWRPSRRAGSCRAARFS